MASNYTKNYGLCQWEATDQVRREEFNEGYTKIDAALKAQADDLEAEVSARKEGDNAAAAANCLVKLLEKTLEVETQKWDIDMSEINLTKYQKLMLYPHLKGNNNQWARLRINGLTSGYASSNNATGYCGDVPMTNDPAEQNFGVCEYTFHLELPRIYVTQVGTTTPSVLPLLRGYSCPTLGSGVTHLDTLNLWFDYAPNKILEGSTIQLYGVKR